MHYATLHSLSRSWKMKPFAHSSKTRATRLCLKLLLGNRHRTPRHMQKPRSSQSTNEPFAIYGLRLLVDNIQNVQCGHHISPSSRVLAWLLAAALYRVRFRIDGAANDLEVPSTLSPPLLGFPVMVTPVRADHHHAENYRQVPSFCSAKLVAHLRGWDTTSYDGAPAF